MRWFTCRETEVCVAYSGEREIGYVGEVACTSTPRYHWKITGVAALKGCPAVSGECASRTGARAALRRAWNIWLQERGLIEAPQSGKKKSRS